MRFDSPQVFGLAASALVLAGWMLGSTLSPPVASSQTRVTPRVAMPDAPTIVPLRDLDGPGPRPSPPTPSRNPFAFAAIGERRAPAEAAADADAVAPEPVDEAGPTVAAEWRLLGIATDADGVVTAVLGRAGDVQLAQDGDELPDGTRVTSATGAAVVLIGRDGTTRELRLP